MRLIVNFEFGKVSLIRSSTVAVWVLEFVSSCSFSRNLLFAVIQMMFQGKGKQTS